MPYLPHGSVYKRGIVKDRMTVFKFLDQEDQIWILALPT